MRIISPNNSKFVHPAWIKPWFGYSLNNNSGRNIFKCNKTLHNNEWFNDDIKLPNLNNPDYWHYIDSFYVNKHLSNTPSYLLPKITIKNKIIYNAEFHWIDQGIFLINTNYIDGINYGDKTYGPNYNAGMPADITKIQI